MKPSVLLKQHREQVRAIAHQYHVTNIKLFGSAMRGDDKVGSDLDLLVEPTSNTTLFDIGGIQFEVSQLLGISVDVLTPHALPAAWRDRVINEAVEL
jgi:uncharacterized protein